MTPNRLFCQAPKNKRRGSFGLKRCGLVRQSNQKGVEFNYGSKDPQDVSLLICFWNRLEHSHTDWILKLTKQRPFLCSNKPRFQTGRISDGSFLIRHFSGGYFWLDSRRVSMGKIRIPSIPLVLECATLQMFGFCNHYFFSSPLYGISVVGFMGHGWNLFDPTRQKSKRWLAHGISTSPVTWNQTTCWITPLRVMNLRGFKISRRPATR